MFMQKLHSIQITSITCEETSELSTDELFLVCQADGLLPIRIPSGINDSHSMDKGVTWYLDGVILHFHFEVLVTLWDHDLNYDPNLLTYLQSTDFEPGSGSGSRMLKNWNGAIYTVNYTYIN